VIVITDTAISGSEGQENVNWLTVITQAVLLNPAPRGPGIGDLRDPPPESGYRYAGGFDVSPNSVDREPISD